MTESLRPLTRPRLYEQVVDRLREYVKHAHLQVGDRLPPERELAGRLGVSRTSVRQAIVALEVQGLVEVRHGGGTYLLRDGLDAQPPDAQTGRQPEVSTVPNVHDVRVFESDADVMDARDALETKLAALAAARRTDDDLQEIDAALSAMAEAIDRGECGVPEDERFHAAVTTAARSPLLAAFLTEIAPPIADSRAESLGRPGRAALSLDQHRRIAEAVQAGDQEAAAQAMHHHVAAADHATSPHRRAD
ncbi:FCD domain-containing protein [Streptomyces sp. NPDC046805]|uniref:FadR/GntR family transcriptional regulator n=1 Tax=Streptomyces sp. NPDC046805 TaxID=3155134 RepID=UPI0033DB1452